MKQFVLVNSTEKFTQKSESSSNQNHINMQDSVQETHTRPLWSMPQHNQSTSLMDKENNVTKAKVCQNTCP
jgi:hypothetical protein